MKRARRWLPLCGGILLAACSGTAVLDGDTTAVFSPASCTIVEGTPSPQDLTAAEALRRMIESAPLYTIPAATTGVAVCRVRYQPGGVVTLEYPFRDGLWLHVKRDPRIEHTELIALIAVPKEQPEALLAGTERAAFGADGCGIDWRQPETQPAEDDRSVTETVYRGDVCNCQGRIRRNADGRGVRFVLRSAC